jgi:hypothetical protein
VGAYGEDSNQTTITNGPAASSNNSNSKSGAVYVYKRTHILATANTTNPPVLDAITPAALSEGGGSTTVFNAADGGDDFDDDGDTLAYTCWFDAVQDSSVTESSATLCNSSNMSGMSFDGSTGVLTWDPEAGQAGDYEFRVVVTDNNAFDEQFVDVTVSP